MERLAILAFAAFLAIFVAVEAAAFIADSFGAVSASLEVAAKAGR